MAKLQTQVAELEQKIRDFISDNARKGTEPDTFMAEYDKLVSGMKS